MLARTPQRPGALVSGIPRDVDLVVALGLAKDPDRRIATVLAFRDAFRDATVGALSRELADRARRELGRHAWGSAISDTAALDPRR